MRLSVNTSKFYTAIVNPQTCILITKRLWFLLKYNSKPLKIVFFALEKKHVCWQSQKMPFRSEFALVKNFACYKPFKGKLPLKCLSDYLFTNINNEYGSDNDDNNNDDRCWVLLKGLPSRSYNVLNILHALLIRYSTWHLSWN